MFCLTRRTNMVASWGNRLLMTSVRNFGRVLALPRMGSFNTTPKILNVDNQDEDCRLPEPLTRQDLLNHCHERLRLHPMIERKFCKADSGEDYARFEKMRVLLAGNEDACGPDSIRILQWNILSQALGVVNDNFARCPPEALDWHFRRYRIVEEIVQYSPDVVCLQEVDHFNFLRHVLGTQGYRGVFYPKPDSPCFYIEGNNGPDGCAIFYRDDKLQLVETASKVLEIWRVQSNQVALLSVLKVLQTGQEICVATTHLKARRGTLLPTLRNEQGKDLVNFVAQFCRGRPTIVCGDFNAEPDEPVYATMTSGGRLRLGSAYKRVKSVEPRYTTWKIRAEGEICHTIDYVFYDDGMTVEAVLDFPSGDEIGPDRVPSFLYPSDHFSLVCDFRLL